MLAWKKLFSLLLWLPKTFNVEGWNMNAPEEEGGGRSQKQQQQNKHLVLPEVN